MANIAGIICLVKDLEKTVVFYEALGFVFKKRVPGIFATAYLGEFWIEFLLESKVVTEEFKKDAGKPKGAGQYIHIAVDDVDAFYEAVLEKGLRPSGMPKDFPWGHREFVVQDPAGYKLVFFGKLLQVK